MINKKKLTSPQIIILGFVGLILIGTLLLSLPISSNSGHWTPLLDAFFTATSATCVTGLIVFDTATHWSIFGQVVILALIQIGGLGVITVAMLLAIVSGKKIGLFERQTMQDSISADSIGGIVNATRTIFIGVISVELVGAILLSFRFIPDFGVVRGIWYSVFHSISAFCNAGFDLMGYKAPFSSLTGYKGDMIVNLVIPSLILMGGLGFATWRDIFRHKYRTRKYSLQTKIILCSTTILLIIPFLYFYLIEFNNGVWGNLTANERCYMAFFQTVTPRTAGFNTADYSLMQDSSILVTILLMLIGGSTGSTAGGMKMGTVAVMLLVTISIFKQESEVNAFNRRIPKEVIKKAAAIFTMYISLFLSGTLLLCLLEGLPALACAFEAASAIATVGLTMGITPELCAVSKILLAFLMFCGRVGGLTIIFAAGKTLTDSASKYPTEKIQIG